MKVVPGTTGRTMCPLSPHGRIKIGDAIHEAKAERGWIDGSVDVVVVSSTSFAIVVRALAPDADILSKSALNVPGLQTARGQAPDNRDSSTTSVPLHGPGFWLDRVNAIWLGAILWTASCCSPESLLVSKCFSYRLEALQAARYFSTSRVVWDQRVRCLR